jgi:formylmethanofuran:tetrahydromethanopterin formyltransferase
MRYPVLAVLVLASGCASHKQACQTAEPLCLQGTGYAQVMQAAEQTLGEMHFAVAKLDAEQGIIWTQPLTGAQFFELWRSDNATAGSAAEANLHTIRRSVELKVAPEDGRVCLHCTASVQRLSLPENEVASVSQAYQMHGSSTAAIQTLALSPAQRQAMAWIDLGPDADLAARILSRIAAKLQSAH